MLANLQSYYVLTAHWWMLASGLVLLQIYFLTRPLILFSAGQIFDLAH